MVTRCPLPSQVIYLEILNSGVPMAMLLNNITKSVHILLFTQPKLEEMSVLATLLRVGDGVVMSKHGATHIIHQVFKGPVIAYPKGVDQARSLRDDVVQADELISIHLNG